MNLDAYNHVVGSTADEFAATDLEIGQLFPWSVLKMHRIYSLPVNDVATLDGLGESPVKRMEGFLKTLQKEMDEGKEIMAVLCFREWMVRNVSVTSEMLIGLVQKIGVDDQKQEPTVAFMSSFAASKDLVELDREILVMIADWLGDMNVYNRSEALKYGIPLENVLACIMGSNFTKLGEDGMPIKDENGKVLKGPNFVPPERHIYATLFGTEELVAEYSEAQQRLNTIGAVSAQVLYDPMATIFEAEAQAQAADEEEPDENEADEHEDEDDVYDQGGAPLFD